MSKESMEANLKLWQQICDFIKDLDDEGVDIFVQMSKEKGNLGDEEAFRKFIHRVKEGIKTFHIVYYNRFACQTQIFEVEAKNAFRAGREFYRKHKRSQYKDCIETIY